MPPQPLTGKFSFFVSGNEIGAPAITKDFGPQSNGELNLSLDINIDPGSCIRAPFDCEIRIIAIPGSSDKILCLELSSSSRLVDIKNSGLMSEIPSYILFKYDDFDYLGEKTDFLDSNPYIFPVELIPDYLNLERSEYLDLLSTYVANGDASIFFPAGSDIGTIENATLSMIILTNCQIKHFTYAFDPIMHKRYTDLWRRNIIDPVSFWNGLILAGADNFLTTQDFDDASHLFNSDDNTPKRVIVEFRDEHNTPIQAAAAHAGNIRLTYSATEKSVADSKDGFFTLQENVTELALSSKRSGAASENARLDEQFIFYDSLNKAVYAEKTAAPISINNVPRHYIFHTLKPADWFAVQQAEVEAGWKKLQRYTLGNKVRPLIDGSQYFGDVLKTARLVDGTRNNDFFHILCWHIDDFDLDGSNTKLSDLFSQGSTADPSKTRAAKTKILKWDMVWLLQTMYPEIYIGVYNRYRQLGVDYTLDAEGLPKSNFSIGPVTVIFTILGIPIAELTLGPLEPFYTDYAHHMKIITINSSEGLVGYCGGMDISPDRITDQSHSESKGFAGGLHDAQLKVQGPAAGELEHVFWMRWHSNSTTQPYNEITHNFQTDNESTSLVQVACTMPKPEPGKTYKMAKSGDGTLWETLKTAINNARQYIYIEDQYFFNPVVAKLLRNKLNDVEFIIVVLPKKPIPAESFGYTGDDKSRKDILDMIFNDGFTYQPGEPHPNVTKDQVKAKMKICHLEGGKSFKLTESTWFTSWLSAIDPISYDPFIYVHAKLMIVDDIFVSCGSTNLDARGLGTDGTGKVSTECNLMSMDDRPTIQGNGKLARDFRIQLWAEHINLPIKPDITNIEDATQFKFLSDPVDGFERYWQKYGTGKIRCHPDWEELIGEE